MNKKKVIIGTGTVLVLLASGISYMVYQNYDKRLQNQTVENFVSSFEKKNFEQLVKSVSEESVLEQGLDQDKLIEKYDSIFNGLGISDIKGEVEQVSKENFEILFQMETPFGKLEKEKMSGKLIKENKKYLIDWNYSLIFSKMDKGDKIFMSNELP